MQLNLFRVIKFSCKILRTENKVSRCVERSLEAIRMSSKKTKRCGMPQRSSESIFLEHLGSGFLCHRKARLTLCRSAQIEFRHSCARLRPSRFIDFPNDVLGTQLVKWLTNLWQYRRWQFSETNKILVWQNCPFNFMRKILWCSDVRKNFFLSKCLTI